MFNRKHHAFCRAAIGAAPRAVRYLTAGTFFLAVISSFTGYTAHAQQTPAAQDSAAPQRHSPLPRPALEKAREAEQHLAANAPDKAIAILLELDKQYPGQPALSLRLAQIYDTLNKNGHALFFYRRYVAQAERPRDFAVERVTSLELMAGIEAAVTRVEQEMGEDTRPVATPTPIVKRMLATAAKDGSLVPIRNEEDFNRIRREGVPETSPETPIVTPVASPIVIPEQLLKTPTPSPSPVQAAASSPSEPMSISTSQPTAEVSQAAPSSPDEDALLAAAFRTADSPDEVSTETDDDQPRTKITSAEPEDEVREPSVDAEDLKPRVTSELPTPVARPQNVVEPPPRLSAPTPRPRGTPANVAYTLQTPVNSGRAADFFHITEAPGQHALVSIVNDVPSAVLTFTITPKTMGEVMSAILKTGEQKRVYVLPGTYDVSANISSNDYSPITMMNTQFEFTFSAGKQYIRRFNKNNIQQLN